MKRIWDISPPVDEHAAVFPGDTRYSQRLHFALDANCPVNVHAITLSPHTGAHADAPMHYAAGALAIGAVDLHPYLGTCRVIHCIGSVGLVDLADVQHALESGAALPQRVVFRTRQVATQSWESFAALAPELLAYLASKNVALVGIDTPSVDPATSQTLDAHKTLLHHNLRVLENLVLDDVPEGDYELIALPLKLMHADASPVRAILREL